MNNQGSLIARRKQGDKLFTGKESFPVVLYTMLDDLETQGLSDIVSWQPHGRCFLVHKRKPFIEEILPVYFRMSKFTSFQRQLNLYGFQRVASGKDKGGYFHNLFLRGRKELCDTIPRQQVKGVGKRMPVNPATQPDFYLMDFLPGRTIPNESSNAASSNTTMMSSAANAQQSTESPLLASMYPSMLTTTNLSSVNPYGLPVSQQLQQGITTSGSETTGSGNFGSFVAVMSSGVAPSPGSMPPAAGNSNTTVPPPHGLILPNHNVLSRLPPPPLAAAPGLPCLPSLGVDPSHFCTHYPNAFAPAPFTFAPAPFVDSRTKLLQRASAVAAAPICNSPDLERERSADNPLLDTYARALQSTYIEALHSAYMDALQSGNTESSARAAASGVMRSRSSEESLQDWMSQNLSCDEQDF